MNLGTAHVLGSFIFWEESHVQHPELVVCELLNGVFSPPSFFFFVFFGNGAVDLTPSGNIFIKLSITIINTHISHMYANTPIHTTHILSW